ncbi:hypothetical protein D3C80_2192660 [compost metagenome]
MTQEVVVTQLRPELLDVGRVGALADENVQGGTLGLADLLFAVQWVLKAAAQGALGLGVELAQEACTP